MKRSLSLLLATLMLVFALTACGRSNDAAQSSGQNGTQSESAVTGSDSAGSASHGGNSSGGSGSHSGSSGAAGDANGNGSLLDDAGNAVEYGLNGLENAVDDMTGDAARNRTGGNMSR